MPTSATSAEPTNLALTDAAARQLTNATKSTAQLDTITPRWLVHLLQWVPVEAGIYRLNRVKDPGSVTVAAPARDESELPTTYVGYYETPREYFLNTVATIVDIHTRISDLYSQPLRPDRRADQTDDRDGQRAPRMRAHQQRRLRPACHYGAVPANLHPHRVRRPRTTSTSSSPRSGRSRRSSWPIPSASPPSGASARGAESRPPR